MAVAATPISAAAARVFANRRSTPFSYPSLFLLSSLQSPLLPALAAPPGSSSGKSVFLQSCLLFNSENVVALTSKVPIPPGQVYAINDALSAERAADDFETCLKHLVRKNVIAKSSITGFPKFDLMLLGMGSDGHVASLFPGHPLVKDSEKWVTYIKDSPKPPAERITLTFPVINSSAYVALVATGAGKADVVRKALGNEKTSTSLLPVEMVSTVEGETTWFSDKDAASKL